MRARRERAGGERARVAALPARDAIFLRRGAVNGGGIRCRLELVAKTGAERESLILELGLRR